MKIEFSNYILEKDHHGFALTELKKKDKSHRLAKTGSAEYSESKRFYATIEQVAKAIAHDKAAGETVQNVADSLDAAVSEMVRTIKLVQEEI